MKIPYRLVKLLFLTTLLIGTPILAGFEAIPVLAQGDDESEDLVKIPGLYLESPSAVDGADVRFTITVGSGCLYSSIAAALSVASDGDLILLEGGRTFYESNLSTTKNLIIQGGYTGCATGSDKPTKIDANNSGYVIEVSVGTVTLSKLNLTGGNGTNGGGLRVVSGSNVILNNTKIFENQAVYGGGIYIGPNSTVTLTNDSDIAKNIATSNGGGARVWGKLVAHDSQTAIGYNIAPNGGGLSVPGGEVDFVGSNVSNNTATDPAGKGGGIHAYDSGVIKLTGSSNVYGNEAYDGAGIFADNASLDISGTIHSNTADNFGGGLYLSNGSILTGTNVNVGHIFTDPSSGRNTAINGGGIFVDLDSTIDISGEIVNNHVTAYGGGLFMASTSGTVNVTDTLIKGNNAENEGGAVFVNGGSLNLIGPLTMESNTANAYGGAISVQNAGFVNIKAEDGNVDIFNNQVSQSGGAFAMRNGNNFKLYATSSYHLDIHNNTAAQNGGAAFADGAGLFDVYGMVRIFENSANYGGAIYLSGGARIWLDDYVNEAPQLYRNTAQDGGAIYAMNSPRVEFDGALIGSELGGNQATAGSGGAVFLSNSTLNAENSAFNNNHATIHGGAVYAEESDLTINANLTPSAGLTSIDSRSESLDGAPTRATGCNPFERECSTFAGNIADSDTNSVGLGGAMFLKDSTMTMSQTYLHHNQAFYGGAIIQTGTSSSSIDNSLIHHNTVSFALGAGIRNHAGDFTLNHVTITDNTGGSGFSGEATSVSNSIVWEIGVDGFSDVPQSYACNIDNGGNAGINVDPLFVNPGDGQNYHLQQGSPAIDACPTGLAYDLENRPRPIFARFDMGVYEFDRFTINLPLMLR
jgi:hypothetical protein